MARGDGGNEQQIMPGATPLEVWKRGRPKFDSVSVDATPAKQRLRSAAARNGPNEPYGTASSTRGDESDMEDDGSKDHSSDDDYHDKNGRQSNRKSRKTGPCKTPTTKETTTAGDQKSKPKRSRAPNKLKVIDYTGISEQDLRDLLRQRDQKVWEMGLDLTQARKQRTAAGRRSTSSKQKASESAKQVKEDKEKIAEMESIIKQYKSDHARVNAMHKTEKSADTYLNDKFTDIFGDTKQFASEWIDPKISDLALARLKEAFARITKDTSKPFATEGLLRQAAAAKGKNEVILHALLNKLLCTETFERPFSHLVRSDGLKVEEVVNLLMERAEKKHSRSQHNLRASILKAIDEPLVEEGKMTTECTTELPLPQERIDRCEVIVSYILEAVGFLLKDISEEEQKQRRLELFGTVEKAIRLAGLLSLQHPFLEYKFLSELPGATFSIRDPYFLPQRTLKLNDDDVDDDDDLDPRAELVGQPLDLVVTPAIVRFGDEKAENYDKEMIVFIGTSWIVKDKVSPPKKREAPQNAYDIDDPEQPSFKQQAHAGSKNESDSLSARKKLSAPDEVRATDGTEEKGEDKTPLLLQVEPPEASTQSNVENGDETEDDTADSTELASRTESTVGNTKEAASMASPNRLQTTFGIITGVSSSDPDTIVVASARRLRTSESKAGRQEKPEEKTTFFGIKEYFAYHDEIQRHIQGSADSTPSSPQPSSHLDTSQRKRRYKASSPDDGKTPPGIAGTALQNVPSETTRHYPAQEASTARSSAIRSATQSAEEAYSIQKHSEEGVSKKRDTLCVDLTGEPDENEGTHADADPRSKKQKMSPTVDETFDSLPNKSKPGGKPPRGKAQNTKSKHSYQETKASLECSRPSPRETSTGQVTERAKQLANAKRMNQHQMSNLSFGELLKSLETPEMCSPAPRQRSGSQSDS